LCFIEREKSSEKRLLQCYCEYRFEIYYKIVGYVELPHMSKSEKEMLMASFGRDELREAI